MEVSPPIDFSAMFADICGDNKPATEFCWTFIKLVHALDDVVDGDKPKPGIEEFAKLNLDAALCFAFNSFWQQHKEKLTPLLIQGVRAWQDSVEWATRENIQERRASDVMKSIYAEVLFHVAYVLGGPERLQKVTAKWRIYNFDVP
jgi:hypothetical protein